ncbi:long-chain fatty acid--CoA ligase [Spongiibacter sp. KMU-158]|uniref:Long-chain fatty acid--CoA ligase n=1 Tax=Spongiibacter pelagi TaxID=2760804 RepID=A0A927C0M9_9GAMM|nr:long-chain fatty acid--CoA ligase [Spongiibacter pelagi]MBD2857486.1 long-chain fatty acid--CoA ligase [Spongiibacter pelagi]
MQFTQGLHRAVQQQPDNIATICDGRTHTFRQLENRVSRLAAGLLSQGFKRGDRIAILSLNSDRYLEAYLAIAWIGAVVNPVNFRWSPAEIAFSLRDSASTGIIVDDHFAEAVVQVKAETPSLETIFYAGDKPEINHFVSTESLIANNAPVEDVAACGDELLGIFYTGGTTGVSKGVMLTHDSICASASALMAEGLFQKGSKGLHAAPMFHLADMMMSTGMVIRGGQHIFLSAFNPETVLALVEELAISDLLLVPAMMQAVVDHPKCQTTNTSSVKNLMYGASPISEALLGRAMEALPTAAFTQVYGMTETSAVMTILGHEDHLPENRHLGRLRSAGQAGTHIQLKIADEQDNELPRNTVGQILSRGPSLMKGYINREEASREALEGGWMHTGDMGYMDDSGYVFVVDRCKDMIISGGENIYSVEVENAVMQHNAVAMCAVIGIPCDDMGERVHAAVVLKPGAELEFEVLREHCKQLIAGYKCPKSMTVLDALPMSGAGKILKTELRKPFWEQKDRGIS